MDTSRSSEHIEKLNLRKWKQKLTSKSGRSINTFNEQLDKILGGGGVELGYLTEIFGSKGVGKTTLCYQLCIDVQLPKFIQGLESEAVFIDTEGSFSSVRFKQMAEGCARHCSQIFKGNKLVTPVTAGTLRSGVHVIPCCNVEEFRVIVLELEHYIVRHKKVKLVVIDSISYLYYAENLLAKAGSSRASSLFFFAQELYRLTYKYDIAIVVTNNMTSRFSPDGEKYEISYLGDTWTPIPHIRLELSVEEEGTRRAKLCKTYGMLPDKCTTSYHISPAGFR